jgi:hypothetical protein
VLEDPVPTDLVPVDLVQPDPVQADVLLADPVLVAELEERGRAARGRNGGAEERGRAAPRREEGRRQTSSCGTERREQFWREGGNDRGVGVWGGAGRCDSVLRDELIPDELRSSTRL